MYIYLTVLGFIGVIYLLSRIGVITTEKNESVVKDPIIGTKRKYYKDRELGEIPLVDEIPEYTSSDLVIEVLIRMGCQPCIREDNNIIVDIMGRTFMFAPYPDEYWIRISEPYWYSIKESEYLKDLATQAINLSNQNFGPKIIADKNQEALLFSSVYDCIFHPSLSKDELEDYLKRIISSFFALSEHFRQNYRYLSGINAEIKEAKVNLYQ